MCIFSPEAPPNLVRGRIDKCGANVIGFNLDKLHLLGEGSRPRPARDALAAASLLPSDRPCSGRVINTFDGIRYSFKLQGNLNECNPDVIVSSVEEVPIL